MVCGEGVVCDVTFADEPLLDESPEHVAAVVAVGGLVEGLLAEAVAVSDRDVGRRGDRRHDPRAALARSRSRQDLHRGAASHILQHDYVISEPYASIVMPQP